MLVSGFPPSRASQESGLTPENLPLSKLENAVIPLYYNNRDQFAEVMRHCIALNGSFFNTHRMLQQYIQKAYFI